MRDNTYRKRRVLAGELGTPVTFYKFVPKEGLLPGEEEKEELLFVLAKVHSIGAKDIALAKQNGNSTALHIPNPYPFAEYITNDGHYVSIDDLHYKDKRYKIREVQPDVQDRSFINIIAERNS